MFTLFLRCFRNRTAFIARTCFPALLLLAFAALPARAQTDQPSDLPPITIGAGLQTSFAHTSPDAGNSTDQFLINSARLYINGPVTDKIKFMFNTEYDGVTNKIGIMDAVARIEMSPQFNIWAGRLLPPSDRANLYGPYYSHHWSVYTDGIQDGYPFIATGRDNGIVYWGDFNKLKVSLGGFDGTSATGKPKAIGAARVQVDLWDPESGYYLNGTYYGAKNLLAIGVAVQTQSGNTGSTADFLLERKLPDGSVISIESEYAYYDKFGGYDPRYGLSRGAYLLGSYLFPKPVGMGKFEILGKYAKARFSSGITPADLNYDQKTSEFNFNYVIKDFNARVMFFYRNTNFTAVKTDFWTSGVGMQIQM
jgi:hypothetical protein